VNRRTLFNNIFATVTRLKQALEPGEGLKNKKGGLGPTKRMGGINVKTDNGLLHIF